LRGLVLLHASLACACGRVAFEPFADGGADAALGMFGTAQPIGALSHPLTDDDPTATGDALELYFASERIGAAGGYADLYVSTRASRSDPWGAPMNVLELNSASEDQSPGVSADGLTIYFSSRRASPLGGSSSNLGVATRASRSDVWGTPSFVAELSTAMDEFEPQPDETGLRLVLYRQLDATNRDIFESTRASPSDPWSTPAPYPAIDGPTDERSPCLRAAGRELWYASDHDSGTPNIHDIYVATRASTGEDFPLGTAVELNTSSGDGDPWISPDGRVILFASDRDGNPELFEAQR
jgi:hypothetical protein